MIFMSDCDNCGCVEERVFTDTWTGKSLCIMCLSPIIDRLNLSPASDGDNINKLLQEDGRKQDAA